MTVTQITPHLKVDSDSAVSVARTRQALAAFDADVDPDTIVGGDWTFRFTSVGTVPGTKSAAFGKGFPAERLLKVRHGQVGARELSKIETEYTAVHEWAGHGGDATLLRNDQRADILKEMGLDAAIEVRFNANGANRNEAIRYVWLRGDLLVAPKLVPYWQRPYEGFCDMLVAALTNLPAMFKRQYTWDIDADILKAILLRPAPTPPPPPDPEPLPEPDPLPPPPPPELIALRAAVAQINAITTPLVKGAI